MVTGGLERESGTSLPGAGGSLLRFSGLARMFERNGSNVRRFREPAIGEGANRGNGWRRVWRGRVHSHFLRDVVGSFGGRCEENSESGGATVAPVVTCVRDPLRALCLCVPLISRKDANAQRHKLASYYLTPKKEAGHCPPLNFEFKFFVSTN